MALREAAHRIIDHLPEDKIAYVISILKGIEGINISEEEPDQFDLLMIQDAKIDNEETTPLDNLVKELGFSIDELQD